MTPKFIEHMRFAWFRVPARSEFASVSFEGSDAPTSTSFTVDNQYRATCELFFDCIAPVGAEDQVRQKAAASFTHHLYGDIRNELFELRADINKLRDSDAQARIAELEDLIGRYANSVANANGVYFEPAGPDGEYIIGLAERAATRAALGGGE
jgi:hypothetical protein